MKRFEVNTLSDQNMDIEMIEKNGILYKIYIDNINPSHHPDCQSRKEEIGKLNQGDVILEIHSEHDDSPPTYRSYKFLNNKLIQI